MCGIAGIYDDTLHSDLRTKLINDLCMLLNHRGPDFQDSWTEDDVSFVHTRLKIIDLDDTANQPFHYKHYVLVFNGEIYNYPQIRKQLVEEGFAFQTQSDTEVVAAAYAKWGDACVEHFVGMWAFAIWDKKRKRMFCSRDRFGIKPFYYIFSANRFYFASEIKALKALPVFDGKLNIAQLNRGLILSWSEYEDQTNYQQIKSLPASHQLIIEKDSFRISRYWDIQDNAEVYLKLSGDERSALFRDAFTLAIEQHSRADVTVGGCLSGGLDSSSIASMYCRLFPEKTYKTFNIFYSGKGRVDERVYVNSVAEKYGNVEAHYYSPADAEIRDNFEKAGYYTDGPILGSSYLSQYFVMKQAALNNVKVLLDGQGADEYLFGYFHSFSRLIGSELRNLNALSALKKLMAHKHYHGLDVNSTLQTLAKSVFLSIYSEKEVYEFEYGKFRQLLNGSAVKSSNIKLHTFSGDIPDNFLRHMLFTTSLPTLLHFEDRMSMAFSLESRVPFLDHRLVELSYNLPLQDKIAVNGATKSILRRSMTNILPDIITERRDKVAFSSPGETQWLRGPLNDILRDSFDRLYWLDQSEIQRLIRDYQKGSDTNAKLIWRLAALNFWMKNFN